MKRICLLCLIFVLLLVTAACSKVIESNNSEGSTKTTIEEQLAQEFTLESGTGFGKKLEDAWKEDKDNVDIAAMYHYYNAKFYDGTGKLDSAKNEMKNINPNYSGVMSDVIVEYGISLFDSIENWDVGSVEKSQHKNKTTDSKRKEIKAWINNRYDYYDKKEGKYCGDKYTKTIFNEAATYFGLTYEEINNVWSDLSL